MEHITEFSREQTYILYFCIIFFATFFAFLSEKFAVTKNRKVHVNKFFWVISFLILFIPLGFRGYGIDHSSYELFYIQINEMGYEYSGFPEPFFTLLNYIVGQIFGEFQYVYIISGFITLVLIYIAFSERIGKNSLTICIMILSISSYFYMFGLVRMFLAVAIIIFAHKYIEQKNVYKYIICCVIAAFFHYSALIMIPLYFIFVYKIEKPYTTLSNIRNALFAVVATPAVFFIANDIFVSIFGNFQWFSRYVGYFKPNFNFNSLKNIAWAWPLPLIVIVMAKQIVQNIKNGQFLIRMFWVLIGLSMVAVIYPVFRITFYLYYIAFYLYAAVPMMKFKRKEKVIIFYWFYCGIGVLGMIFVIYHFFGSIYINPFLVPYYFNLP